MARIEKRKHMQGFLSFRGSLVSLFTFKSTLKSWDGFRTVTWIVSSLVKL